MPVLVVTGAVGAGKSTVVGQIGDQLEAAGVGPEIARDVLLAAGWLI